MTRIKYNNGTVAEFTNDTRVLHTLETYLEKNIIVEDINTTQAKSVSYTPSETAQSGTVEPDNGYDGLSAVNVSVGAISPTYVGSGITQRSSSDLTASGDTVTVPSGYYASQATKAIASASLGAGTASHEKSGGYLITKFSWPNFTAGYLSNHDPVATSQTLQNETVTPSTVSQTITPTNYAYYLESVTVEAMPSGTAGTPTASKGTVSNHSISVTPSVTNTTGYITGGTKTGTAVTVSASELVSGTVNITASGNTDVTNYATASVASGSATASATKGTVSNHSVTVIPSVTRTAGYITSGSANGTAVTVSASELASGNKEITSNGTNIDVVGYSTVSVNVSGGGGSSVQVDTAEAEVETASSSIIFTGLKGEPTSFLIIPDTTNFGTSNPPSVAAIVFDGTAMHGQTASTASNANASYDTGFTKTYSNGTLTVTATTAVFVEDMGWVCEYTYGGSASNIDTKDVQVGSGATSITFTGLEDEPLYWSCIFKSNFSTSSGYQRVMFVRGYSNNIFGFCLDYEVHGAQYWTSSYSNGSLTISSQGTNAGGYFHQPGYYQLTYVYDATGNYQSKTVTPTTSQQIVEADTGYDALKKVTVNAIPNTYVQPTSTVGSTTYRASTSSQTIASGTYHSAAATIAAVTQTNLTADNIKSGTTVTISNGQSNLWSVTGTYSGGGGGSANLATETTTNSSNQNTSISFTLTSGRTVKAFFCRLTSQIARNSNSRYYYVFDMRWDGSSSGGVAGNQFYMYNGTLSNVTSGYSYEQDGTTFTLSSTGSRSASPGSFYNGTYELVYVY